MLTHTIFRGWANGPLTITKTFDISAGAELNIDEEIPAATPDRAVIFALTAAQLKALFLVCDKAVTVETNSSSAPTNTFTLAPNVPFLWAFGDAALRDTAGTALANITSLFVTNAGADAALLQVRALFDPTA